MSVPPPSLKALITHHQRCWQIDKLSRQSMSATRMLRPQEPPPVMRYEMALLLGTFSGGYRQLSKYTCMQGPVESYDGAWRSDEPHGHGKLVYRNGDVYEGTFSGGFRQHGTLTYKQGPIKSYKGAWDHGEYSGRGLVLFVNGHKYDGEFTNGLKHGEGTITYEHGPAVSYTGSWRYDQMLQGIMVYRSGDTYNGPFLNTHMRGEGVYTVKRGALKSVVGLWQDHHCYSGVLLHTNNDRYTGQLQSGKYHGPGVYRHHADNMSHSGQWIDGERSGFGKVTFGNGEVYTDVFADDAAVGGSDARYIKAADGTVTHGEAALQLARDHGAEQCLQRARKQPRRMNELDAEAVDNACAGGTQKKCKTTDSSAAATEVDATVGGDGNNTVHAREDAQSCIYAYT
eukprot:8496-Heterococcus_DN1.PRE.10